MSRFLARRAAGEPHRFARGACAAAAFAVALGICFFVFPARAEALSEPERRFASYLIRELGYFDTAEHWVLSYKKRRGLSAADEADLESLHIDILKGKGEDEAALKKLEEFKKKFPNHARATTGEVEIVGLALADVLKALAESAALPKEDRDPKVAAAAKRFELDVLKSIDGQIAAHEKKYNAAKDAAQKNPNSANRGEDDATLKALFALTQTELARLNFSISFARKLPRDLPIRKTELDKAAKLAEKFVGERFDYPVMQYNGQLQLGIAQFEMGLYDAAYDNLSLLIDIEPPMQPPFARPLIEAFKALRIQSLLFASRANNALGRFAKTVSDIETHLLKPSKSDFSPFKAATETDYKIVAVLLRLEYGVALAGAGQTSRGLEEIQRVIDDKSSPAGLITDARNALGRVALAGVRLRGRDHFQAAIGLKSEHRWEEALNAFQVALGNLNPATPNEMKEFAPLCLNEIGEINFLLGRFVESALAYEEACVRFPSESNPVLTKVAKNFAAAMARAIKTTPGGNQHKVLARMYASATEFSNKVAGDAQQNQLLMFEARNLEQDGRFGEAREKYLQIPAQSKGEPVPQYWGAQAGAWACLLRQWEQQSDVATKQHLATELEKGIGELNKIYPKALSEKNPTAAAKAILTLGQIYISREDWGSAAKSLQLFGQELAAEEVYGSTGLGSLIIAESRAGLADAAAKHFAVLAEKYKSEPVVSIAALEVADSYRDGGNRAKAAEYVLAYMEHPASKSDLEQPAAMAQVAQRLIDGGKSTEAAALIERIKQRAAADPKNKDEELERQVVFLEGKSYAFKGEWEKAIAKFNAYVKDYKIRNEHYEDPYVCRDLMEAYLQRTKPEPTFEDLKLADQWGSTARVLMQERSRLSPALEPLSWQWLLEFLEVRLRLAAKGDVNKYLEVIALVDDSIISMGESDIEEAEKERISAKLAAFKEQAQAQRAKPAPK